MGTHPIFESDFDCLTEREKMNATTESQIEQEIMVEMYERMITSCHNKCIAQKYIEADLNKAESVCTDRCVSKYMDLHDLIGKEITEFSMKNQSKQEAALKK